MKIEYFHASEFGNGAMVAEDKVLVTGLKGPLEDGWQRKVEAFASQIYAALICRPTRFLIY